MLNGHENIWNFEYLVFLAFWVIFSALGKGIWAYILPTLPNQPQNAKWARKRLISGQNADSVSLQVPQPASLVKLRTGFGSLGMNPPFHCRNLTKLGVQ